MTGDGDWGHVGAVHPAGRGDRVGREELSEHGPSTEEDAGQPARQKDHGTAGTSQSTGSRNVRFSEFFNCSSKNLVSGKFNDKNHKKIWLKKRLLEQVKFNKKFMHKRRIWFWSLQET